VTTDVNALVGHSVLWIGSEAAGWGTAELVAAARQARAWGYDTIAPKRADGSIRWYGTADQLAAERAAVLAEGVGYLPFAYCYGPKFGLAQVDAECAVLQEMGTANAGAVMADLEAEWDGQIAAAARFASNMRPWAGVLYLTTWADPAAQDWIGVAQALAPCVNAWVPQRYDDWLAAQPPLPEQTLIQPGIDLTQEFGANDPATIAAGHPTVWVWEYQAAQRNPTLAQAIARRAIAAPAPAPAPAPTPTPTPTAGLPVTIQVGVWPAWNSYLEGIAQHYYGDAAKWPVIWQANRDAIPNPNILHPRQTIIVPAI
jgi:hypothetical protein